MFERSADGRVSRMTELQKFWFFCHHERSDWMHAERTKIKRARLAKKYPGYVP